jgi:hypothetical protein
MTEKLLKLFFSICLVPILCCGTLWAQAGRGGINGLITDPTGAIVPGAKVVAQEKTTGVSRATVSTATGLYSFVSLNPGAYKLTATMMGFQTVVRDNVGVTVDQVTGVNLALPVGNVSEVVTVTEAVDLVDASNSTVGQLVSSETIDRVPLMTRNVFELAQLSAGVSPANGAPNSSGSAAINGARPEIDVSSYSFNGAISGSVYYMLDGSPLGIAENNVAAIMPAMEVPEDGVEETRVETQNTPASYQSGGAGVISIVSKAGGNKFHGTAFGVFRPDLLAANEYFNKQTQLDRGEKNEPLSYHRYQEGGSIGGRILRDKLFFFGDYEDTQQESYDSALFSVPTTAERTGNFSADSFKIYDPSKPDKADGTRQAFTNNVISNPNPIALKFLSMLPKCNRPSPTTCDAATDGAYNNFYKSGLDPLKAHKFDTRIDWAQSERQRIFGRYSYQHLFFSNFNAFGNMWDLYYFQNITKSQNILLADDLTLTPTTVLQLRYSFTRHYEDQTGDPAQNGFDITTLGFPSALAAEQTYKTLPYVTFSNAGGGIGGTANWNTFLLASENSDVSATLTKVMGSHELSFGFEYMKRFLNVGQPPAPAGAYNFDRTATSETSGAKKLVGGSDFASFLLGMGTAPGTESYNFTKDLFVAEASPYYSSFAQDIWHVTKDLTVTAGLRWDIFGGRTERHNRLEYFDRNAQATANGVSFTGGEVFAKSGARSPFTANLKDFSPRLGVSWQAMPHLVVRAGGGFYYGPSAQMVANATLNSDGYSSVSNWNATAWNNDAATIAHDGEGSSGNTVMVNSLSNPFPSGVVGLTGNKLGLATYLGSSLNTVLHSQRTQTTYNFNFGVEYEFPHAIVFSAGYVGSRGLFLPLSNFDLNELDLATIGKYKDALANTTVANRWEAILPSTNNYSGSATVPLWFSLQQYPQFGDGTNQAGAGVSIHGYPGGDSEYSSLQSKLQKRLTKHFTTIASFTWAKLMTNDANPPLAFVGFHGASVQDSKNMNLEHSVSTQDVKYQFNWQVSYDLPFGSDRAIHLNRAANLVAGGWTVNGIAYISTGVPVAAPSVGNNSYFNQRTDMTCDPSKGAPHTAKQWFKSDCFTSPSTQYIAGSAPATLDHVRTMGANDVDISLFKNVTLPKEMNLRFDLSAYNIANRAQFSSPNVSSLSDGYPNFGEIYSTSNSPRQFQVGARYTF